MTSGRRGERDVRQWETFIGCTVVVGLTYLDPDKTPGRQEQFYGVITYAGPEGLELTLSGSREGESYWLPPQVEAFEPARPGVYRLRSTGEELVDPDYTTTWFIEAEAH